MKHLYFSDWFFILSTCLLMVWMLRTAHKPRVQKIWLKFWMQPLAVISSAFILIFWLIALLDSIHIHDMTIIDSLFFPLSTFSEYSYSIPFGIQSFLPQITKTHGQFMTHYNHLKYVPLEWTQQHEAYAWMLHQVVKASAIILMPYAIVLYIFRAPLSKWPEYKKNVIWFVSSIVFWSWIMFLLYLFSRKLHVFGTSQAGYDILYQAIKSIRTGLMISLMTTMFMLPFALVLGLLAGFYGKWIDAIIQFLYSVISSIPTVLLITAGILSWQVYANVHFSSWSMYEQADMRLVMICVLLGLSDWSSLCRYIRAEVLKLRELDFIKIAILLRTPKFIILFRHLLPNIMHLVIMSVVLNFSYLVLAESVLTYIGIGVSPLTQSWGNLINAARLELARTPAVWWPIMTAFGFMFPLVLACNFFADGLRKALNPREEVV